MSSSQSESTSNEVHTHVQTLGTFVAIFWGLQILNFFIFHGNLRIYGIHPHHLESLPGIFFAPFLHASFGHLIGNTIPFVVLGWLTMLRKLEDFWKVTFMSMMVGGLGVWVFGSSDSVHIGSSILVFGYLGFLLFRGYFQRNIPSILLSIVVFLLYGSLLWGMLPLQPFVSWQGHLFGFIGGALTAKYNQ